MLARALLVLLLALNLGVAAWWTLRASPPPVVDTTPVDGPRLRLVGEAGAAAPGSTSLTVPSTMTSRPALPADAACVSFGPFADVAAARSAVGTLAGGVVRTMVVERPVGRARAWRVLVPALPTREAAQALAARIAAAGFTDWFVMPPGPDENAIALGRYRGEEAARARAAALVAAGFAARAEPVGAGATQAWLDVAASADFDPDAAQLALGVAQQRALDCATLPPPS